MDVESYERVGTTIGQNHQTTTTKGYRIFLCKKLESLTVPNFAQKIVLV